MKTFSPVRRLDFGRIRLSAALLLLMLPGLAAAAPDTRRSTMKTLCLGRHLVEVPSDSELKIGYEYAGGPVVTQRNVDRDRFLDLVAEQERRLKATQHRAGGTMLVQRAEPTADSVLLTSWSSPTSRRIHAQDFYLHVPAQRVLYHFTGQSDETRLQGAVDYYRTLGGAVRYRDAAEIPKEAGFCIDSGFIARNKLGKEGFTAGIRARAYPSVSMTLTAYVTGKPDADLLTRVGNVPPGYAKAAAQMKPLRRGQEDIGPFRGQELLVRADAEGKRSYEFLWETQGKANSLGFPFISLELSTTGKSDAKGKIVDAPFKSDEEAIGYWDSVLKTLRLRPGAA